MEIERKFLVNPMDIPSTYNNIKIIKQGYLNPKDEWVIRVRSITEHYDKGTTYIMEIKSNALLIRDEYGFNISEDRFNELYNKCCKKISKTRYYIKEGNYVYELDIYDNLSIVTVEVEFKTEKEAKSFNPPNWFGEDVTYDISYKNLNLAK